MEFKDDAGQRVLRYDHLVVWDAGGRELEARMEVRIKGGEGEVWLEVDDRVAVWPVTIDPTFTRQDKLLAADAASFDGFGNSVAISGETVVVGAELGNGTGVFDQGSAYVFADAETPSDTPSTITLKAPISLWPPNHKYRTVIMSQMVQSASDAEDGNLINIVVIEKVTSDKPDNASGGDGNTSNDIVIADDCKSVQLRSERDGTKNGHVYSSPCGWLIQLAMSRGRSSR